MNIDDYGNSEAKQITKACRYSATVEILEWNNPEIIRIQLWIYVVKIINLKLIIMV